MEGAWFGGQDLAFDPAASSRLAFTKDWITRENVLELAQTAIAGLGGDAVDLVSLDLDGNDLYLIEELLEGGVRPRVFIAEYNAKFMPPLRFAIAYDPSHQWASDDYFGASLASLDDAFSAHGYRLVCCNAATGGNAFFVRNEFSDRFADVPEDIRDIYVPPNYNTYNFFGHKVSVKTVLQCIA